MRVITAYLMDGRGQSADGRRKATPLPIVLDDAHDAVEESVEPVLEPVLDAAGSEDEEAIDADAAEPGDDVAVEVGAEAHVAAASPAVPASRDPYAAYMSSLRDVKRLDREEEHVLAVEYLATHDPKIARTLIT